MRGLIKKYLLPALVQLQAEKVYHLATRRKLLNIFYHGVVEKDSTMIFPRHITREQFDQHMRYIRKNFDIISLDEAFELKRQGLRPERKTLTVSFDDGYLNNLLVALPIIEKYRIPTTFFVSGICARDDKYMMWSDILAFVRYFIEGESLELKGRKFVKRGKFDMTDPESNLSIFEFVKGLMYIERDEILNGLLSKPGMGTKIRDLPAEYWKLMNREQIRKLSESELVTIGSHGHLHYNLANISEEEARNEMELSRSILSEITQREMEYLSFPDGSYNENIKKIAYESGYKGLLAVDYRCASDKNDKYILNRWGVSATTTFETIAFTLNKAFINHGF